MHNAIVIYNAVESYQALQHKIILIATFALLLILVYILHSFKNRTPKRVESKAANVDNRTVGLFLLVFSFLIFSVFLSHTHSSVIKAQSLLETKTFQIVEGEYIELNKKGKIRYFSVAETTFNYSPTGALNPGRFDNDCTRKGCLLKTGNKVRVFHSNLEILKIELLEQ